MVDTAAEFSGSMPEHYDSILGPAQFEAFAADLVRRLPVRPRGDVLELACGTGILTQRLRERIDGNFRLVATDVSDAMLAYARNKVKGKIDWRIADMQALPFKENTFGLVVCAFGLLFGFVTYIKLRDLPVHASGPHAREKVEAILARSAGNPALAKAAEAVTASLTLPFEASVVVTAQSDDSSGPIRSSFPSRFGDAAEIPAACMAGVAWCSPGTVTTRPTTMRIHIAAKSAQPWRVLPTILPKV